MNGTVLVDLDSVLNMLWITWYGAHNDTCRVCDRPLQYEDVIEWDTAKFTKCGNEIYGYLKNQYVFESAPVAKNAVEGTRYIQNAGFDLYVVSSSSSAAEIIGKLNWLGLHFPHIPKSNIIMAQSKHIIVGDYIIDDKPGNLYHPAPYRLLFDHPWNRGKNAPNVEHTRVTDWNKIIEYFSNEPRISVKPA